MLNKATFPYAAGFRSLTQEIAEPTPLRVFGDLPPWLEGTLLRTGPSKFEVGKRSYNHWFDGLAMLHRFAFSRGKATYANRFLKSKAYLAAKQRGKIAYGEFATDPCRSLFGRVAAIFDPKLTDNCNVNVVGVGSETVAFTETTLPVRFDPDTLATLGVRPYQPPLSGQVSIAHPHYDAERKRHYSYMVDFGLKSRYRVFSVGADGKQSQVAELPVDRPAYMHSFAMTEQYLVLAEFPLVVSALALRFSGKPFIQNYRWEPELGLRFRVIDKDSGMEVAAPTGESVFAFHHVNAFEDRGFLFIDMIAYPDSTIIDELYLDRLRSGAPIAATGLLTRFQVPLSDEGPVTHRVLSKTPFELPRLNYENCVGKRYRYAWGTGIRTRGDFLDSIVKVNVKTGDSEHWYAPGLYPGEPVFVPTPSAESEDDGVLLSVVLDVEKNRSFLLVLDAATLKELARAEAPHAIPFHFHGNYFARNPGETSP